MSQLAIKGHPTRGKEVIEILEMLGGGNLLLQCGWGKGIYLIDPRDSIIYYIQPKDIVDDFTIFTLEEFLEKYPYKVGDKVYYDNKVCDVIEMLWNSNLNTISYGVYDGKIKNLAIIEELQPYKEQETKKVSPNFTINIV